MVFLEPAAELLLEEEAASGAATEVAPGQLSLFTLDSGLPTLLKLSMTFAAIGTAALAVAFIEVVASLAQRATSWIPFFGSSIEDGIKHGVQFLTNRIGTQYRGIDGEVGYGLHQLAEEVRLVGADMLGAAFVALKLSQIVAALGRKPDLGPVVHNTRTTVKQQTTRVTNLTTKVVQITKVIQRPASPLQAHQIHALQARVQTQQAEIVQLQHAVKAKPHPSTLAQAAEVTALGLAGLGLNTLRCEGTRDFNQALCRSGPQGLGRLTSLLGLGALFLTLEELARAEHGLIQGTSGLIRDYWRV